MGKTRRHILFCSLLIGLIPVLVFGSETKVEDPFKSIPENLTDQFGQEKWDSSAPVDIQSKKMHVDFKKREIVFNEDVVVNQADFNLTAEKVTALFGENSEDIRKILATGDVIIKKGDKVAMGDEAVYNRVEAVIVLRGNPRLKQGKNYIRGEEIRVFLNDDRMEIEGGKSGVEGIFHFKEKK